MSSKKFVAPDRPEGAATMDIAQLKEMNISALTQVAKYLDSGSFRYAEAGTDFQDPASADRKERLHFQ
jgi:hypothetical protein